MPRVAPSQLYGSEVAKTYPVGPAGIRIPDACAVFRKTVDPGLLSDIVRVAEVDYRAKHLPEEQRQATTAMLVQCLRARFPAEDMEILARYGYATSVTRLPIQISFGDHEDTEYFELAGAVLRPKEAAGIVVDLGGRLRPGPSHLTAPAEVEPYFQGLIRHRRLKKTAFDAARLFPGRFRTHEGRFPRWFEIEREFPLIGAWLAEQRASL
ncbi:hypothetical protein CLG96_01950 [Sphingomonas oleivorans]|uniref:Uncharacterized protein n=2 Tax=Sphingomonas oleivorans TaxID=1735121 RepID=A0A2T5G1A5_9SPHN|nr:hypothetical protein CLG96_01950 [Sphingomonas oleivorans]